MTLFIMRARTTECMCAIYVPPSNTACMTSATACRATLQPAYPLQDPTYMRYRVCETHLRRSMPAPTRMASVGAPPGSRQGPIPDVASRPPGR